MAWAPTRNELIAAALRKIGILQEGQSANTNQTTEGTFEIQALVNSLQNEGIGIHYKTWTLPTTNTSTSTKTNGGVTYRCIRSHTSAAGNEPGVGADWQQYWVEATGTGTAWALAQSYTTMGDFSLTGIVCLMNAYYRYDEAEYELSLLSDQQYGALNNKGTTGAPEGIYYNPNLGKAYLYPQPDSANYDIRLNVITAATDLATDVATDFPVRANQMLVYCLAWELGINKGIPAGLIDRIQKERDRLKNSFRTTDVERKRVVRVPRFVS